MKKLKLIAGMIGITLCINGCGKSDVVELSNITNTSLAQEDKNDIDIDLTTMSSTMVYSEVYQMMIDPESYVGKKIKMKGQFQAFEDQLTGDIFYACIIQDATACCAQGMEFQVTDQSLLLQYLKEDENTSASDITVVGEFEVYEEQGNTYCRLKDAEIIDKECRKCDVKEAREFRLAKLFALYLHSLL